MLDLIQKLDNDIAVRCRRLVVPMARLAIFVVYFWFGILKVLGVSPAEPLVTELFQKTLWFLPFTLFYIGFAVFEMVIGMVALVRGWERVTLVLIAVHLISTVLPLFVLPAITWHQFLVPTLEGQYIIKNILIAAAAITVASSAGRRESPPQKT